MDDFFASHKFGPRLPRFRQLAEDLCSAGRPIYILETGCMREETESDGCSTLAWDYIARETHGGCITVDISPESAAFTKTRVSDSTTVICQDSVLFLSSITTLTKPIDLLYLDSMDFHGTPTHCALSALHHAAELSAAWRWLAPDALIAIDDCHSAYLGKHAIVRVFMDFLGVEPLTDDYITVWRKPKS